MKKKSVIGLIPARSGSLRVKSKNTRDFFGHPLISYTIKSAIESNVFDRIIVSTDSKITQDIAIQYGAESPFLRPPDISTSTSLDIEWIKHVFSELKCDYEYFSIIRPTSPFRTSEMYRRGFAQLEANPSADSLRAVELCKQHPGKMWTIENDCLKPFIDQGNMEIPWRARQYQDLPRVYVQNSSLEIARSYVVEKYNSREGKKIIPFLTNEIEGFSIDYEIDWEFANIYVKSGRAVLPNI